MPVLDLSTDTLISIVLGALLVFWAVGAHNRLVRLKNAVTKAYEQVDAQLQQRQELLARWLAGAGGLDETHATELAEASRLMQAAMDLARQRPATAAPALALQAAEHRVDAELAALWQSPDLQQLVPADADLRQLVLDLVQLESRLELMAEPYNQAVQSFNEAAQEFPAWFMARLAGFKPLPGLVLGQQGAARDVARPLMLGRRDADLPPTI